MSLRVKAMEANQTSSENGIKPSSTDKSLQITDNHEVLVHLAYEGAQRWLKKINTSYPDRHVPSEKMRDYIRQAKEYNTWAQAYNWLIKKYAANQLPSVGNYLHSELCMMT
jgi:hypothetical protein